jgi:hypothetical protein
MTRSRYTLSRWDASAARKVNAARLGGPWLGAGAVAGVALIAWPYTVDDAFIVARYARNLASGVGYCMNAGTRSDGVTGPLWLLPQLIAVRAGIEPVLVAKLLGASCAAGASWLLLRELAARALGSRTLMPALALIALSPSLGTAGVSGLETGAATLLLTLAAIAATRRPKVRGWTLGVCVAALAWLRPELALACGVLLASAALRDRRAGAIATALALAGAAALVAWRWTLFDDWLPLSARAKAGPLAHGARYTLTAVVLATSLVGVWLAQLGARRGHDTERVFAATIAAHLCAVVLSGGDWMPGYRLLVPILPLYAWLAAWGVVRGLARKPLAQSICLALALLVPAVDLVTRIPELRAAGASQRAAASLAARLRARARVVALVDVGYLAYASGVEVVDLGGLTDPVIARSRGGHLDKRIDDAYLQVRNPDALLLHAAEPPRVDREGRLLALAGYPIERRVAALPWARTRFRVAHVQRYAPGYYYVLLTARDGT